MSNWHYCRNGKQIGPIALDDLKQMISRGELDDGTLVWQPGMSEWTKLRKRPELVSSLPPPPPLPSTPEPAPAGLFSAVVTMLAAIRH